MGYKLDSYDNSLVIDGWEKGIADDPTTGISDMRNVNLISVPGEASVNFSTQVASPTVTTTGTVSGANAGTFYATYTGATGLAEGQAITFSAQSGLNVTTGTVYWILNLGAGVFQVTSDFQQATTVHLTNGTGTFTSVNVAQPKHGVADNSGSFWMVDATGRVWRAADATTTWRYTGNQVPSSSYTVGNGLVYYEGNNGDGSPVGYIFVFHNSSIDYTPSASGSIAWVYQWSPSAGTAAGYNATPSKILKNPLATSISHEALLAPDNKVYFVDANWVDRFYQTATGTKFNPASTATYTWDQTKVLPFNDSGQCLAPLGNNILIGGQRNVIYPWDTFSSLPSYPILVAESNIVKMTTVNTNTYALVGNRGRIYYTNGSQAQLWKKIPDHISGTVEPYYQWGGLASTKNQVYFSFSVTDNAGTAINQYGGMWAVDVDTKALRLTNKLSYATYAGLASVILPIISTAPAGTGMFIGWDSTALGATGQGPYGIDKTISTPYTSSQATIDSDLIPIGTFNKPRDFTQIEYKLTKPMVSGESITIQTRLIFNTTDTGYTTTLTDSTAGNWSNSGSINFKNAQWVQFKIILNSTASTPSYTRLRNIRILGLTGPTMATSEQLAL